MIEKEIFIEEIENAIENGLGLSDEALEFFNKMKSQEEKPAFTDNGKKVLQYAQANWQYVNNIFTSKNIGEGLEMPSRSVSGSMRKLVSDGYMVKVSTSPVAYAITDLGKEYPLEKI